MTTAPEITHRAVCTRCLRPETVCYCRLVTPIATKTRVVILQHPRERHVPVNTARIASLSLPDAELKIGVDWPAESFLGDPSRPAALLYPGPDAIDIEVAPPSGPITLIVVDGTWWQARKLVRANPALAALPRYAFRREVLSGYVIRKQPHDYCVSTIEALAHVLGVLEGDHARFDQMLAPFRAMVEAQIEFATRSTSRRHTFSRHHRAVMRRYEKKTSLPVLLRDRAADLLCVHGEANAWPRESPERTLYRDELVHWVALRPHTGETFEAFIRPEAPIREATPIHLRVASEVIAHGMTPSAFAEAWSTFVRPSDVLCTWGPYAAALFEAHAEGQRSLPSARIDVRQAARNHARGTVGEVDAFRARLGLETPSVRARGRAGVRLAELAAITRGLAAPAR